MPLIGTIKDIIFYMYHSLSVFLLQYHDEPIYIHIFRVIRESQCFFLVILKILNILMLLSVLFPCLLVFCALCCFSSRKNHYSVRSDLYIIYSYFIACAWKWRFDKHTEMKIKKTTHQRKKANLALCISLQENLTSNNPYRHCPFLSASISFFTKSSYVLSENQRLVLLPCYYYCT